MVASPLLPVPQTLSENALNTGVSLTLKDGSAVALKMRKVEKRKHETKPKAR